MPVTVFNMRTIHRNEQTTENGAKHGRGLQPHALPTHSPDATPLDVSFSAGRGFRVEVVKGQMSKTAPTHVITPEQVAKASQSEE